MNSEIPHNRDITYFAKTNFRSSDEVFGIKRKDRRQHMYVLGKSGTGKSVLLSNLIVQNIQNGEGVCVVDPHGELVEEILNLIPDYRAKDVIYFNPADSDFHIGFNVMQLEDLKYKHLVASGLMGIFTKIWANAWSSRMEYILNNTILALLDTPNTTMLGIPRMLVDKDYRQMIINNLKDPVVKAFWVHEYEQWREQFRNEAIAPIQNKVGQFLSTSIIRNVVGQEKSTIDIFKIMNEGKIFLVNVSKGRIGEDNSALLGGMIITKIQLAAMERVRIPEEERKDFYLYVDEFQNFATDSFANILSEARKYRLCLTIAHQYTAQIDTKEGSVKNAVFGNVGTMIIFRVGADDADFLEKEFEPEFTAQDLVNLPNFNIYLKLMIDGITSRPFSATTLPPLKIDPKSGVKESIIEMSRKLYTRPRLEVETEILRWSGTLQMEDGESKYKADCSNCKKMTMVPFEPKEGKPVYCKECMYKIKNGELKPESGFIVNRSFKQDDSAMKAPLASLGIEFPVTSGNSGNFNYDNSRKGNNNNFNNRNENNSKVITGNYNNNNFNKNKFDNSKKKHSGPSPLLKNLLQKISINKNNKEGEVIKEGNLEITEVKDEPKKVNPISLSDLKKNNLDKNINHNNTENNNHTKVNIKEASEEKKASLKDLLSKVSSQKEESKREEIKKDDIKLDDKKEEVKIEIPIVKEPVIEKPKPEIKIETPKPEIKIEIPESEIKVEAPRPEIKIEEKKEEFKKEEINIEDKNSWQKRKAKKEVPEDVLKKVLE